MALFVRQVAALLLALFLVLVAFFLLVAGVVAWLEPMVGLAGALGLTALGFLIVAAGLVWWVRVQARKARQRRRAQADLIGLVELALLLVPRKHMRRLVAGVTAGAGLATLVAALLRPAGKADPNDNEREG
jgi:hypothetical protein